MGGFFKDLWPFGKDDKPVVIKPEPIPMPVPIDPHEPPAPPSPSPQPGPEPGPVPVPPDVTPPPSSPFDRLFVDGQEVDSYVIPETGINVRTELAPLSMKRGQAGKLVCVLEVEPLASPADREALHAALHRTGDPMKLAGAHSLIVTAMPIRNSNILMSAPKAKADPEAVFRVETKDPNMMYFKLFFWGAEKMRMEITIPFNIAVRSKIEDPFDYFDIKWYSRRVTGAKAAGEMARKIVTIA